MTADEIRKLPDNVPDEYLGIALFLQEIAAQLAELNQGLKHCGFGIEVINREP